MPTKQHKTIKQTPEMVNRNNDCNAKQTTRMKDRLGRWEGDDAERRVAVMACTRRRWSRRREAKTGRRTENPSNARATAMNTTINCNVSNKHNKALGQ